MPKYAVWENRSHALRGDGEVEEVGHAGDAHTQDAPEDEGAQEQRQERRQRTARCSRGTSARSACAGSGGRSRGTRTGGARMSPRCLPMPGAGGSIDRRASGDGARGAPAPGPAARPPPRRPLPRHPRAERRRGFPARSRRAVGDLILDRLAQPPSGGLAFPGPAPRLALSLDGPSGARIPRPSTRAAWRRLAGRP